MDTTETQNEKIALSVRFEPAIHAAILRLAKEDDRPSFANMVERLLKTHPRVQKQMAEAEAVVS
jgi:hypothetical protein